MKQTRAGFCGGTSPNPSYARVCADAAFSDWAECVQVDFDEQELSFEELCEFFFVSHEPSVREKKRQYMSCIFAHDDEQFETAHRVLHGSSFRRSVSTSLERATDFYEAELYHQKWMLQKSPWLGRLGLSDSRQLIEPGGGGEAACKLNAFVAESITPAYLRWYASSWVEAGVVTEETYERLMRHLDST